MNQAKVDWREPPKLLKRLEIQLRKRKNASALPCIDLVLHPRCPKEVWLLGASRGFLCRRMVHVITPTVVLCAVFTNLSLVIGSPPCRRIMYHCGKVSSQRMCLLLHVLQPFLDFVWLLRVGPAPCGAMGNQSRQMLWCFEIEGLELRSRPVAAGTVVEEQAMRLPPLWMVGCG